MTDPLMVEQNRLRPDMDVVTAYGEEHPESFGGVRWNNEPIVRIEVWFIGDLDAHRRALHERLRHPERLALHPAWYTRRHLESLQHQLMDQLSAVGCAFEVGMAVQSVTVRLPQDAAEAAEALVARYGDAIELEPWTGPRRRRLNR
jgi:hypothetical protein